jgi:polysaccharide pyruvyl transferase CsaB
MVKSLFTKSKKVFIIGGYGSKNFGDEAILAGIIETVRKQNPNTKFTVIGFNPKEVEQMHGVSSVGILNLFPTILFHDTIIVGGGTIFRPKMRLRAQLMPLVTIFLRLLNKKIMFYSLGINKRTSKLAKFLLVPAMGLAQFVSVRDLDSLEILKHWGIKKDIEIVPDPAINLSYKKWSDKDLEKSGLDPSKKLIGLSLRNLKTMDDLKFFEDIVSFVNKRITQGYQIIYLPMCKSPINDFENDLLIGEKIQSEIIDKENFVILRKDLHPSKLKGLYARLSLVVGMRLHSMILAISTQTPLIGITYAQKCRSYLETHNEEYLELDNVSLRTLNSFFANRK